MIDWWVRMSIVLIELPLEIPVGEMALAKN